VKIKGRHSVPQRLSDRDPREAIRRQGPIRERTGSSDADDFTVRKSAACSRRAPGGGPSLLRRRDPLLLRAVFRVKQDAVRGWNNAWFQATVPAPTSWLAELCGVGTLSHAAQVVVHTQERLRCLMKQAAQEAFAMTTVAATAHTHPRITTTGASSGSISSRPITRSSASHSCSSACSSC